MIAYREANGGFKQISDLKAKQGNRAEHTETKVLIDIKGAVKQPGVYDVSQQPRLQAAVAKAGGLTDQAEILTINLAQKLTDGQMVRGMLEQFEQVKVILSRGKRWLLLILIIVGSLLLFFASRLPIGHDSASKAMPSHVSNHAADQKQVDHRC
ncbi:hypothetical protein GQS40_09990|uniref:Soluble ligand binding domain-containing protein n=1 Tax=Leuconostoc lactis TaxID=1246 RepID=A0A6L7AAR6_LEULA|nr:hypothetical protein [Leuconostoc lactis]